MVVRLCAEECVCEYVCMCMCVCVAIISWGNRLKLQKPESAVWCPNANNDEMISHILGKLIMGRDLQCELSFSAAHAMTKYEVWSVCLSSEVFVCLCKASSFPRVCVCVCVCVSRVSLGAMDWSYRNQSLLCDVNYGQGSTTWTVFFSSACDDEKVVFVLRHCAGVCVCVCLRVCILFRNWLFECNIENLVCEREVSYFQLKSSFVKAKLLIFSRSLGF